MVSSSSGGSSTRGAADTIAEPPVTRLQWTKTCRLIPSRFPTIGVFDRIAAPADLAALIELDAWTNDRLSNELGMLHVVPHEEWVVGPMASVVMAAFCHPRPTGSRFSGPGRGAWYAARTLETALAESIYHRTRELEEIRSFETRMQMRLYHADLRAAMHDIRARRAPYAALYDRESYEQSQRFGRELFDRGSNGIVYRSVRHEDGECVVCFRPKLVVNLRVAAHYEYRWDGRAEPLILKIR